LWSLGASIFNNTTTAMPRSVSNEAAQLSICSLPRGPIGVGVFVFVVDFAQVTDVGVNVHVAGNVVKGVISNSGEVDDMLDQESRFEISCFDPNSHLKGNIVKY
jgi:hypothetical protein